MWTMKPWNPEEIKNFREQLNMFQKDFAALIGVSRQYVNYLEKGVKKPSKTLKILLSLLEQQENEQKKGR